MTVPTEKDWGDYHSDLDQEYAHGLFAGHTNQEMQLTFAPTLLKELASLRFMPEIPFCYYMIGFRDFVIAGDFEYEGADAASCFLRLVLEKLEKEPACIASIMPELLETVEHVARNQSAFDADMDIYGDFHDLFARIRALNAARGGL